MTTLEFGASLQSGRSPVEVARLAESLGFDYVTCGEHLMFHGPTTNAFITLSMAAAVTSRVRLASTVTLLPLYPPVLAAKLATSLDVASDGRFTMGVGVGGEFPAEFESVGINVAERGRRTNESLEVIDLLMTTSNATFHGDFTSFESATLSPRPIQQPRIPVWIAGRRDAAIRRAVRFGDGWMPYLYTPEQVSESRGKLDEFSRDVGRGTWAGRTILFAFTTVYSDGQKARRVAAERVGAAYNQDFGKLGRYLVAGTPQESVARLREYVDAGVEVILFRVMCPPDDAPSMMRLIASEVMPALRAP